MRLRGRFLFPVPYLQCPPMPHPAAEGAKDVLPRLRPDPAILWTSASLTRACLAPGCVVLAASRPAAHSVGSALDYLIPLGRDGVGDPVFSPLGVSSGYLSRLRGPPRRWTPLPARDPVPNARFNGPTAVERKGSLPPPQPPHPVIPPDPNMVLTRLFEPPIETALPSPPSWKPARSCTTDVSSVSTAYLMRDHLSRLEPSVGSVADFPGKSTGCDIAVCPLCPGC